MASIATGQHEVLNLLAGLVRINSVNPAYEGGRPEGEIAAHIRRYFSRHGIETFEQEVFPGRPNLIARLPGRSARRLVFEAHTDTASVQGMTIAPFEPLIADGRMFGRGACDTKGGLAAMMAALVSLKRDGVVPPCEVWVVAAADEEYSFRGVVKLCEGLQAAGAVVAEPTAMRLAAASKGVVRWKICCQGRAAHSSKPELGLNAISNMARVVLALEEDGRNLARNRHPLLGPATVNVGVIQGGRQVNFVADFCSIEIDRRLLPGEEIETVLSHYEGLLNPAWGAYMEQPMLQDYPLETPSAAPIVSTSSKLLGEMGLNGEPVGVPFGSDASKLSRAGVPSIIFGPGSIDRAHGAVEYVECDQVVQACEFYRRLMTGFE